MDTTCDLIEHEIKEAASQARALNTPDPLRAVFSKWMKNELFLRPKPGIFVRETVLNELTFLLSAIHLRHVAWEIFKELVRSLHCDDPYNLKESIVISTLELAVEPPETPWFLDLLFGLYEEDETGWAVTAAFANYPHLLQQYASAYRPADTRDPNAP
jgi:hypothetical protein